MVSRFSTIAVAGNVYSVPSRLIGTSVLIRVHSDNLDAYHFNELLQRGIQHEIRQMADYLGIAYGRKAP